MSLFVKSSDTTMISISLSSCISPFNADPNKGAEEKPLKEMSDEEFAEWEDSHANAKI